MAFSEYMNFKGVTHLGPIWYHLELSDVPYFPNQFLVLNFFFALSYSKIALDDSKKDKVDTVQ